MAVGRPVAARRVPDGVRRANAGTPISSPTTIRTSGIGETSDRPDTIKPAPTARTKAYGRRRLSAETLAAISTSLTSVGAAGATARIDGRVSHAAIAISGRSPRNTIRQFERLVTATARFGPS